ncbi:MAG: cysteine methyltransferase [Candidatus Eisenbacteria bacterium]|nr:cysteine methyltransferase [Candidatus Eisenbacteria bacterium]
MSVPAGRATHRGGAHERIRRTTELVPPGRVASYGQIAEITGGVSPRMVGYAMAALEPGSGVPWHRVVNARGEISLPPGRGREEQRALLEAEGVSFDERGRIDLETYGWRGPAASAP